MREGGILDPRSFFKFDPGNSFWTGLELYARAFRGELGAEQKNVVEQRLKISQADGPGGRWFRDHMGFMNPGGPTMWITTLWSPQAGYLPVSTVRSHRYTRWQAPIEDRMAVEADRRHLYTFEYQGMGLPRPGGQPSKEQTTTLKECTLNRPLNPHQFDERGLGMSDGDLVLNHLERVAYIIKGGEPVKLANFGEGSILRPAPA